MVLVLLRHGALALENQHRLNGWSDLSIDEQLFEYQKIKPLQNMNFDEVYSSDLKRATQTLDKLGLTYKQDVRLREIEFKESIEGKSFEEIEKLEEFDLKYLADEISWAEFTCKESLKSFEARIKDFLESLDLKKQILICSHAGTIKMIMKLLKQPIEKIDYLEFKVYR